MITFTDLVRNFPTVANPCSGGYTNQCAIRMSIALAGADPDFLSLFRGNRCAHGHARSAQRLANYLRERLGAPEVSDVSTPVWPETDIRLPSRYAPAPRSAVKKRSRSGS